MIQWQHFFPSSSRNACNSWPQKVLFGGQAAYYIQLVHRECSMCCHANLKIGLINFLVLVVKHILLI